jgi:pyruvate dehydrogenase E1 component
MGGTAGRTTLSGEGLQHQDGHSHVLASTVPTCKAYDPAYAFEMAVIIQDGIKRMYAEMEDCFYYITHYNEFYVQPPMPEENRDEVIAGIVKGIYKYRPSLKGKATAQLFGSGPILNEALRAQEILHENYQVATDVWSVTSYNELRREALAVERWNLLHPAEETKTPHIVRTLNGSWGPVIAATDYMKIVPDQLSPWIGNRLVTLGADGFGRSDNRTELRRHFEINAESIVAATLSRLVRDGKFEADKAVAAFADLGVDPEKIDSAIA